MPDHPAKTRPSARTPRKGRVFVNEFCTGCGGAPICQVFCPRGALVLRKDPEANPFFRMEIDPARCTRCGACIGRGPMGQHLLGCPWDAIQREHKEAAAGYKETIQPVA